VQLTDALHASMIEAVVVMSICLSNDSSLCVFKCLFKFPRSHIGEMTED